MSSRRRVFDIRRSVWAVWNDLYRGVQIGRWWIGWTNPTYKRRGW